MSAPDWKSIGEKLAAELVAGRDVHNALLKLRLVESALVRQRNTALAAEADQLLRELVKPEGEFPPAAAVAILQSAVKVVRKLEREQHEKASAQLAQRGKPANRAH